jgi:S-adenosylmethionine synthetase
MNSTLRKAIYKKQMFRGKFEKRKSDKNWEKYISQRNLVNKLKKNSIRNYFSERCGGGSEIW